MSQQSDRYRVPQKVFLLNIFLNKNQLLFSYFLSIKKRWLTNNFIYNYKPLKETSFFDVWTEKMVEEIPTWTQFLLSLFY